MVDPHAGHSFGAKTLEEESSIVPEDSRGNEKQTGDAGRQQFHASEGTASPTQSRADVPGSITAMSDTSPAQQTLPDVSIVIVSYRCRALLVDCLTSLRDQRATQQVIVIDNASGDDTIEVVRNDFPEIELVASEENLGFGRANNLGFEMSRGRAILALNPDTVIPPGALDVCLEKLWSDPKIGLLTPKLVDLEGRLDRRSKRGFPTIWASFCYFTGLDQRLAGRRAQEYTMGWLDEDDEGDVVSVSGAFMLMPAEVIQKVGGFDEQFFMYAEDMDLSIRITNAGYRVHYWPRVEVVHVGAGSNVKGQRPPAADAAYFRTMAPFMRKHIPGLRGRATAAVVGGIAETMLAVSRLRGAISRKKDEASPL